MKKLHSSIMVLICLLSFASCHMGPEDDGSRGFADVATIVGNAETGYYCYLGHHGGLAISYSTELADKERGYFNFSYMESDWATSASGIKYIDNVHVRAIEAYDVFYPITQEAAESAHITDKERCTVPELLRISRISGGYMDLSAGFATFNHESGKVSNGEVNLVYSLDKQEADTLRLQLCYNPSIPNGWTKTSTNYRTVSCDISALSSLLSWKDSLTLVIEDGSKEKQARKISKNDFQKPEGRIQ